MKGIESKVDLPAYRSVVGQHLVDTVDGKLEPLHHSMSGVLDVGERLQVRIAPVGAGR